MSEKNNDRICFMREGESGMNVEIVGSADTLRSMIHAALMNHKDLRVLIMPVMLKIMADKDFKNLCVTDMLNDISKELGLSDDEDEDDDHLTTD